MPRAFFREIGFPPDHRDVFRPLCEGGFKHAVGECTGRPIVPGKNARSGERCPHIYVHATGKINGRVVVCLCLGEETGILHYGGIVCGILRMLLICDVFLLPSDNVHHDLQH